MKKVKNFLKFNWEIIFLLIFITVASHVVDYRYFVEAFENKRALDWYPQDYEKAETLFVIDETGKADILKSNIMEILKFKPKEVIGRWELPKGIVIYKLNKSNK